MSSPKQVSAPIRMSPALLAKVTEASRLTGMSQADVLRLCLAIGLEDLKKVKFDLAKLVSDVASSQGVEKLPILKVAEAPPYGSEESA